MNSGRTRTAVVGALIPLVIVLAACASTVSGTGTAAAPVSRSSAPAPSAPSAPFSAPAPPTSAPTSPAPTSTAIPQLAQTQLLAAADVPGYALKLFTRQVQDPNPKTDPLGCLDPSIPVNTTATPTFEATTASVVFDAKSGFGTLSETAFRLGSPADVLPVAAALNRVIKACTKPDLMLKSGVTFVPSRGGTAVALPGCDTAFGYDTAALGHQTGQPSSTAEGFDIQTFIVTHGAYLAFASWIQPVLTPDATTSAALPGKMCARLV
jgi:hypothetical protein